VCFDKFWGKGVVGKACLYVTMGQSEYTNKQVVKKNIQKETKKIYKIKRAHIYKDEQTEHLTKKTDYVLDLPVRA